MDQANPAPLQADPASLLAGPAPVELDYTGEDPKNSSVTPSQTATQQKGVIKLDQADPGPFQADPASLPAGPAPLQTKVAFNQQKMESSAQVKTEVSGAKPSKQEAKLEPGYKEETASEENKKPLQGKIVPSTNSPSSLSDLAPPALRLKSSLDDSNKENTALGVQDCITGGTNSSETVRGARQG